MLAQTTLFTLLIASLGSSALAAKAVLLESATSFCILMPPTHEDVGTSEGSAITYCYGDASVSGAKSLSSSAITGAHYVKTNKYVQITGTIDSSKTSNLVSGDEGGQYDNAPKGSEPNSYCENYNTYVEILSANEFCVRCCTTTDVDSDDSPCNVHHDEDGCSAVIGGSYSSGFTNKDESNDDTTTKKTTKKTTATTEKTTAKETTTMKTTTKDSVKITSSSKDQTTATDKVKTTHTSATTKLSTTTSAVATQTSSSSTSSVGLSSSAIISASTVASASTTGSLSSVNFVSNAVHKTTSATTTTQSTPANEVNAAQNNRAGLVLAAVVIIALTSAISALVSF